MSRLILSISIASLAFILGIAADWSVNTVGALAVDTVYDDVKISLVLPDEIILPRHHCGRLIVTVSDDGVLDLNTMVMGSLDNTSLLRETLRTTIKEREELHAYVDSLDLPLRAPEDRIVEKTVYIKAPRNMTLGEVSELIAVIKEAGADPVGLIADHSLQP